MATYRINTVIGLGRRLRSISLQAVREANLIHLTQQATNRGSRGGVKRNLLNSLLNSNNSAMNNNITVQLQATHQITKFASINCRSVKNKSASILDHVIEHNLDIVSLTETWLSDSDQITINELTPTGYQLHHVPRPKGRGGGVAVLAKDNIKIRVEEQLPAISFESIETLLSILSSTIRLITLYRIPPSARNKITRSMFVPELTALLDSAATKTGKLLIAGDFNIHYENSTDCEAKQLKRLFHSFGLIQHVETPTHTDGHMLDLICSRQQDNTVASCSVSELISDHHAVHADLKCARPHPAKKVVWCRNTKTIDRTAFSTAISNTLPSIDQANGNNCTSTVDTLVTEYTTALASLLDIHAPQTKRTIVDRLSTPWFNENILSAKREW